MVGVDYSVPREPDGRAVLGPRWHLGAEVRVATANERDKIVGPYRLMNLLITGQTSQIWEGMRESDRARHALKMLLPDFRKDREQLGFLKHEYEVGRNLDHPGVVKVFDFAAPKGVPYLAMELYTCGNLKQVLRSVGLEDLGPLLPDIVRQAAEALAYFNNQGWIHRDIKPDNFLLTPEGQVKLIDFALAQRKKTGLSKLFGGGSKKIQGTKSYMSPEQIRGEALDERADVYSFGCTAYELFNGKPPFTGTNANELLMKHLTAPPPAIAAANSNTTLEFSDLLRKCMAKKPADRPQSMQDFVDRLRMIKVYQK